VKEKVEQILGFELISWGNGEHHLLVGELLAVVVLFLLAKLTLLLVKKFINRRIKRTRLDEGRGYAILQLTTYFVYTITILLSLDFVGFHITVILASSTALLVGLGLGLQDVFKDWVAGFVLLAERSITAGDIVEVDKIVGEVEQVGLRTTILRTRDDIILVLPNQRLTSNYVINWTQNKKTTRFAIDVGVAYGSDTSLVKRLLLEAADNHNLVNKHPSPLVFFSDFGNSSLDFKLLFFSDELLTIERTKSDLRFLIDKKFRENGVTIPFPQRDLWIKNPKDLQPQNPESFTD
jgi:small-conductance mechanosensitive channel